MNFLLSTIIFLVVITRRASSLDCYQCTDCATPELSKACSGTVDGDFNCETIFSKDGTTSRRCCNTGSSALPLCGSDTAAEYLYMKACDTGNDCNNEDTSTYKPLLKCHTCSENTCANDAATDCAAWSPTHTCEIAVNDGGTIKRGCCETTDDSNDLVECASADSNLYTITCRTDSCNDNDLTPMTCSQCKDKANDCDIANDADDNACPEWSPNLKCETFVNVDGHTTRGCCKDKVDISNVASCADGSTTLLYHKTCSSSSSDTCNKEDTSSYEPLKCHQCTNDDDDCDTLTGRSAQLCSPFSSTQKCETVVEDDGTYSRKCCETSDSTSLSQCESDATKLFTDECATDSCNSKDLSPLTCYQCNDCKTVKDETATPCTKWSPTQKCETYISSMDGKTKRGCCETDAKTSLAECTADTSDQCDTASCNDKDKSSGDAVKVYTFLTFMLTVFSVKRSL